MWVKKQVRTIHGTIDWFNIGKGIHQGCILSFCLFNLYAEYIKQNVMLDESLLLGLLAVYVLSHAHPCMNCSLDIANFLEDISSLSHFIVFLEKTRLPGEISITSDMQMITL